MDIPLPSEIGEQEIESVDVPEYEVDIESRLAELKEVSFS